MPTPMATGVVSVSSMAAGGKLQQRGGGGGGGKKSWSAKSSKDSASPHSSTESTGSSETCTYHNVKILFLGVPFNQYHLV